MKESIENFVRETLGCNCSAKVFEQIEIDTKSPGFDGLECDDLIKIGGRLLLLIAKVDDGLTLLDSLSEYIDKGRQYRDENGFNRFRLLIACNNKEAVAEKVMHHFENLENKDDRLHVHVLLTDELPLLDL